MVRGIPPVHRPIKAPYNVSKFNSTPGTDASCLKTKIK